MLNASAPRHGRTTLAERLRTLPRDARDTLFLLAVVGWLVLPQVDVIPPWASALVAAILLWRGWLAWHARPLPGRWWTAALLATAIGGTLATYGTIAGRDAGVTLVIMLLALKTLELRARRDAFVVFFLGFFTMLTNFFFSQSLLTAAAMLVALLGLLMALVNAHMPVGRPPLAHSARIAGGMALLGAPVMLVLFLLFPRLAPLWGMPGEQNVGRTGLSERMEIGKMASLAMEERIAMRIRFLTPGGTAPPQQDMYFRGPVFGTFDGREWRPLSSPGGYPRQVPPADLQVSGPPIAYEVTLEPHQRPWLLLMDAAVDKPETPGMDAFMTQDLQWLAARPVSELLRYRAVSYPAFRHGPAQLTQQMTGYLQLPEGLNPRTRALAQELRHDPRVVAGGAPAAVALALARLRTGGYAYTLDPGVYGRDTADEFWFDRREGFCEHIASAFVVLMRAMDIPARIVTGYQGGELNPVDGYWTVRQADAHAWAEVWYAGRGWVRVDPTGAVAPGRTGQFQRLQAPQGIFAEALGTMSPGLASQLRAAWEAVNNRWNQWVLSYTQNRQLDLLKRLGFNTPSIEDLGYVLAGLLVAAALAGAGWTLWERRQHDPWLRLLGRARQRMRAAGIEAGATAAPRALATQLRQRFGDAAQGAADWLLRMEQHRYAHDTTASLAALQREFRQLDWPAARKG
jgi:protein-glutamine gamma-glutamyltransferase